MDIESLRKAKKGAFEFYSKYGRVGMTGLGRNDDGVDCIIVAFNPPNVPLDQIPTEYQGTPVRVEDRTNYDCPHEAMATTMGCCECDTGPCTTAPNRVCCKHAKTHFTSCDGEESK